MLVALVNYLLQVQQELIKLAHAGHVFKCQYISAKRVQEIFNLKGREPA